MLAAVVLPAGYAAVVTKVIAEQLVDTDPRLTEGLREDGRSTRIAVWRALCDQMADDGLVTAGHAQLAARASVHAGRDIARSTAGNHVRALVAVGALLVAQYGASAQALQADRDRAPTYVIITGSSGRQAVDEVGHLPGGSARVCTREGTTPHQTATFSRSGPVQPVLADTSAKSFLGRSSGCSPGRIGPARREHPERYAVRTGPERQIAVAWLAGVLGWAHGQRRRFAAITDKELSIVARPWFAAGWSPQAILRALQLQPDGLPWPGPLPTPDQRDARSQPRIRSLPAVLTARLSAWRDPLGRPGEPPIPTERPRRGRPPVPPAGRPAPAGRPGRSDQVEAELAAFRARAAAAAAERDAARQHLVDQRRGELAAMPPVFPAPVSPAAPPIAVDPAELARRRAVLRARVERANRPGET